MREDNKIIALANRVGPLLVDIPRLTLIKIGAIPDILRVVVCIQSGTGHGDNGGVRDPRKLAVALRLVEFHVGQGDRVILFCDHLDTLAGIYELLGIALLPGSHCRLGPIDMHTPAAQRVEHLQAFRQATRGVICLSRVGDTAIDLPGANVLIQVGCASKSTNQEVQRTGRIQRRAPSVVSRLHIAHTLMVGGGKEEANATSRNACMDAEGYVTLHARTKSAQGWPCVDPGAIGATLVDDDRFLANAHLQRALSGCAPPARVAPAAGDAKGWGISHRFKKSKHR